MCNLLPEVAAAAVASKVAAARELRHPALRCSAGVFAWAPGGREEMDASVSAASDDRVGNVHCLQELTRPQSPLPPFRRCSSSTSRKGVIVWYPASKALAEKAAWKFAEENGLDVVAVNPGIVLGEMIPPRVNASMAMFLRLLEGCTEEYKDLFIGPVHVEDVALAHVLLYENLSASGRHLCVEPICHWSDFAAKVAELYPDYKVPKFLVDTQPGLVRAEAVPRRATSSRSPPPPATRAASSSSGATSSTTSPCSPPCDCELVLGGVM